MNDITKVPIPYLEMGGGFLLGLATGYALKKSFKGLLFIGGFGFIFMLFLESQGAVSIDQIPLQETIDEGASKLQSLFEMVQSKFAHYPALGSASALAGLVVGLKNA